MKGQGSVWFEVWVRPNMDSKPSAQVSIRMRGPGSKEEWIADTGYADDDEALKKAVWMCRALDAQVRNYPTATPSEKGT